MTLEDEEAAAILIAAALADAVTMEFALVGIVSSVIRRLASFVTGVGSDIL